MIYTVPLLLLVAIGHVEPSGRQEDEDNQSAKRELLEGNYGLRIQPSILIASNSLESQQEDSELYSQKKTQALGSFEISPPVPAQLRYAEHKIISDNFQQTLKQSFESLKQPQFTMTQYHNNEKQENLRNTNVIFGSRPGQPLIVTDGQNNENQEDHNLNFEPQKLNQNHETTKQKTPQQDSLVRQNLQNVQNYDLAKSQEVILQQNTLPVFSEIRPPRLDLDAFLPRLEQFQPQSRPIYSEQIIQQIFPQIEGYSQDFFQQINELGNQLSHNTVQYFQFSDDEQTNADEEKKKDQNREDEKSSKQGQSTTESQKNTSLTTASIATPVPIQSTQAEAVSYARFSQGLPLSNDIQRSSQQFILHQVSSPILPPQLQPLPQTQLQELFQPFPQAPRILPLQQLQTPELFQPLPQLSPQAIQETTPQQHLQPVPVHPLFQPLPPQPTQQPLTSVAPLRTVTNQAPQRTGVIRIQQETNQGNQPPLTSSPQNQQTFSTRSQNQDTFPTSQPQFTSGPQITLNSESTFASQIKSISNESPVSTTISPRSTFKPSSPSTDSSTTTTPVSIVPEFASTLSTNPTIPTLSLLSASPPEEFVTSTSSPALPPRPDSEVSLPTISTSFQPLSTSTPISQSHQILASLQVSEPQLKHQTTKPQTIQTHSVQLLTSQQPTLQPLPPLQPSPTLPPLPPLQPLPTSQTFSFPLAPQQLQTLQSFPVIPQSLPTLQPYLIQPLPQQQIPAISAFPIQRNQIQTENQQFQAQQQQGSLQLVPIQQEYQAQIQLQPPPQQHQIHFQPQLQQLSQYQLHAPQNQSENTKQSQYGEDQVNESEKKKAAIAHAHQLLYGLYSPFIQRPEFSESQEIVVQPQAASIAYPASYPSYPTLFASPALSSPQFFGKYAHDIFGGQLK